MKNTMTYIMAVLVLALLLITGPGSAPVLAAASVDVTIDNSGYTNGYILPGGWAIAYKVTITAAQTDTNPTTVTLTSYDITAAASASGIDPAISDITIFTAASTTMNSGSGDIAGAGANTINCGGFSSMTIPNNSTRIFYVAVQAANGLYSGDNIALTMDNLTFTASSGPAPASGASSGCTLKVSMNINTIASALAPTGYNKNIVVPAYSHPVALFAFGDDATYGYYVQSKDQPATSSNNFVSIDYTIIDTAPLATNKIIDANAIYGNSWFDTSLATPGSVGWGQLGAGDWVPNPTNISDADFTKWAVYEDINNNRVWDPGDVIKTTGSGLPVAQPDTGLHHGTITFSPGVNVPVDGGGKVFLLCFQTGPGWGADYVGYGDEFSVVVDTITITAEAVGTGRSVNSVANDSHSGMVYELVGPVTNLSTLTSSIADIEGSRSIDSWATPWRLLDGFFGLPVEDPTTGRNNNQFLDYVPDAVLGLNLTLGPVTQWSSAYPNPCDEALQSVTLRFNFNAGGFDVADLRAFSADKNSGICLYRDKQDLTGLTTSFSNEFDENDELIPISVAATRWLTVMPNYADLLVVLQSGEKPPVTNWGSSSAAATSNYNVALNGPAVDNSGMDYFVTVLLSESANADDSFTVTLVGSGMEFTNGYSNPTDRVHIVRTDTIVVAVPTTVIDMVQYWPEPGKITEQSDPMAVLGFNVRDNSADTDVYLKSINLHVMNPSGTNFTVDELLDLASDTYSGVAIYRDNTAHPLNTIGMFDSGIDYVVPLDGSEEWTYSGFQDHYDQHYLTLTVANPPGDGGLPNNDAGGYAGADYFIVIRTSSTASDGHSFYFKLVDPAAITYCDVLGNDYSVTYRDNDAGATNHEIGDGSVTPANDMWSFTGNTISVVAITAMSVEKLTTPGQMIDAASNQMAVLGLNVNDGGSGQKLNSITVTCTGASATGAFASSDLATLGTDYTSGLSLYQDNGDSNGVFDAGDDIIQIGLPVWSGANVTLNPSTGFAIPDNDIGADAGNDFFVVLRTGATINFRDSFVVALPPGGVATTSGASDSEMTVTSDAITCRVPVFLGALTAVGQMIGAGDTLVVFGINMRDTTTAGTDGNDRLTKITLAFSNIGADFNFTASDLAGMVVNSTISGVALWQDTGAANIGDFSAATDTMVPFAVLPTWYSLGDSQYLTLDIQDVDVPANDAGNDAGYDFYIVITSSRTISYGDNFSVAIPNYGLETLSGKAEKTVTSSVITSDAITSTVLTDLAAGDTWIESHGETRAVIGINVYDGPTGVESIGRIAMIFHNVGGDTAFTDTDLATLNSDVSGGLQLYRDDGSIDGSFDAGDHLVPLDGSQFFSPQGGLADTYSVTLVPLSSADVPLPEDNISVNNIGADFFIVLKTSSTLNYGNDFYIEIPANGITYSSGPIADTLVTGKITGLVPTIVSDVATETTDVYKKDLSDSFAILGVNCWDDNRGLGLKTVKVTFANVSGFNLNTDIMVSLYGDDTDAGFNGTFDTNDIACSIPVSVSINGWVMTLAVKSPSTGDTAVPNYDGDTWSGNDFFVVVSTANSAFWGTNDKFRYGIYANGIEYETAGVTIKSTREGISGNMIIGDITPPGFVSTTTTDPDRVYKLGDTLTFTSKWTEAASVVANFVNVTFPPENVYVSGTNLGNGNFYFAKAVTETDPVPGSELISIIATDVQGNTVANTTYYVEIDNDSPVFYSWWPGDTPAIYRDGETVTMYVSWNAKSGVAAFGTDSIVVSADFSQLDSGYDTNTHGATVTRLTADTWIIRYAITAGNTRSDDTYYVRLLANDYATYVFDTSAKVKLDNTAPQINNITYMPDPNNDSNVRNGKWIHLTFDVNETTDSQLTTVDFSQVDATYTNCRIDSFPNSNLYEVWYFVSLSNDILHDNNLIAVPVSITDLAGNTTTDSNSIRITLDNYSPLAEITSPSDSMTFNSTPISIFGTALDVDGNSNIAGQQASEVASVHMIIDTSIVPSPPYALDTYAFNTADTSTELLYSKWQVVFNPTDTAYYYINIVATDKAGNPVSATAYSDSMVIRFAPALADIYPPTISNVRATPNPFSPNGDQQNDTTYLQYTLSELCRTVTIRVYNSVNDLVKTISGDTGAGANEEAWGGRRESDNAIVTDGDYTFTVDAVDMSGNTRSTFGTVRIAASVPTISGASANSPISPNGDNINDRSTITFTVNNMSASQSLGSLNLVKTGGLPTVTRTWSNPVYTLASASRLALKALEGITSTGNITVTVTGKDVNNSDVSDQFTVPAGTATGSLILTDNDVVFKTISEIAATTTAQAAEDFNYDFTLYTKVGTALVNIVNPDGSPVANNLTLAQTFIGAGTYSTAWPSSGSQADGDYYYQITVADDFGNQATASGQITCASTALVLSNVSVAPTTISPNGDNVLDNSFLQYRINKAARITVQITHGATVDTTLVSDTANRVAGIYSLMWTGDSDAAGAPYLADGSYTYKITADDAERVVTSQGTIIIDKTGPDTPVIFSPQEDTQPYYTKVASITVTGLAEAASTVNAYINGGLAGSAAADAVTGEFTINGVAITEGLNRLYVSATDAAGNVSAFSYTERVVLDTLKPEFDFEVGGVLYGDSGATSDTIIIAGETVRATINQIRAYLSDGAMGYGVDWANSTISLLKNGVPVAAPLGTYYDTNPVKGRYYLYTTLSNPLDSIGDNGAYTVSVVARDLLNNNGTITHAFTYENLTPSITTPSFGYQSDNVSLAVAGLAQAGSIVYFELSSDSGTTFAALDTVAANATLNIYSKTVTLPATDGAYVLRAYAVKDGAMSNYSAQVPITLNRTFPSAYISYPPDGYDTSSRNFILSTSFTGGINPTYVRYEIDANADGTVDSYAFAVTPFQLNFGVPQLNRDYAFRVKACKNGETQPVISARVTVTHDSIPPRVSTYPETGSYLSDTIAYIELTLTDTGSGIAFDTAPYSWLQLRDTMGVNLALPTDTIAVSANTLRLTLTTPLGVTSLTGPYRIVYSARDKAGNVTTSTAVDTFYFVNPTSAKTRVYLITTGGDSILINEGYDTNGLIAGVNVTTAVPNGADNFTVSDESGVEPITLVWQTAGSVYKTVNTGRFMENRYVVNISQPGSIPGSIQVSFVVDTTAPSIYPTPDTGSYVSSLATLYARINDTSAMGSNYPAGVNFLGCTTSFSWRGGVDTTYTVDTPNSRLVNTVSASTTGAQDGSCSMTVTARDYVGNATTQTYTFIYDSQKPDTTGSYAFWSNRDTTVTGQSFTSGAVTDQDVAVLAVQVTDSWIDAAATSLLLYSPTSALVSVTAGHVAGNNGLDTFYLYLTNPLNTVLEAGTYRLVTTATDRAGNARTDVTRFTYLPVDIEKEIADYATIEDTPTKTGSATRRMEPLGEWTPLVRFKMLDASNIATVQGIMVDLVDSGGRSVTNADFLRDPSRLAQPGAIFGLFSDAGGSRTGYFDTTDQRVSANYTQLVAGVDTQSIVIAPLVALPVADTYTYLYVAMRASRTMDYRDSFTVRIPVNGLLLNIGAKSDTFVSGIYSANIPVFYNDLAPDTPLNSQTAAAVIGINIHDNGQNAPNAISTLKVTFAGGTNFSQLDIAPLANNPTSGVALYYDYNRNGRFDAGTDSFISMTGVPTWGYPNRVTMNFTLGVNDSIPAAALYGGDSYFVVIRTSSTIQTGDEFRVQVQSEDLGLNSGDKVEKSFVSRTITANADYEAPTGTISAPVDNIFVSNRGSYSAVTTGGKADIVFFIDYTPTMSENITDVKNNVVSFAQNLENEGIDYQLSLYAYSDVGLSPAAPTDTWVMYYGTTTSVSQLQTWLGQITTVSSGGEDEMIFESFHAAYTQVPYRPSATKFFVAFTDGSAYDETEGGQYTVAEGVSELVANNITAYVVADWGIPNAVLELNPIALATGGETADITGNIGSILTSLSSSIAARTEVSVSVSEMGGTVADLGGAGITGVQIAYQQYPAGALSSWYDAVFTDTTWKFSYQALNLPDGRYIFYLRATDGAGNSDTADSVVFNIDSTDPTARLLDTFSVQPSGLVEIYGEATGEATGAGMVYGGVDTSMVIKIEASLDNLNWTVVSFGGDGVDNDRDGRIDEEKGDSYGVNDDWANAVAGIAGDYWYDDLTGLAAGVYEPGVDDVYLGVASDTDPARYKVVNTILYRGSNSTVDATNNAVIYSLQDEDFTDTARHDDKTRWVYYVRPTALGVYPVYIRVTDEAGNMATSVFSLYNRQSVTAAITDLVAAAMPDTKYIEASSDPKAVLGINVSDGTGGTDKMTSLQVLVASAGATLSTTDFTTLSADSSSGVAIYQDNGNIDGFFDAYDQLATLAELPKWSATGAFTGQNSVSFIFQPGMDIPDNDLAGDSGADYFVVVRTSATINYKDSFTVAIAADTGVRLLSGQLNQSCTASLVTAKVPVVISALADTGQWIGLSDTNDVLRIFARDNGSAVSLATLTLRFANLDGGSDFTQEDILPVQNVTSAGGVGLKSSSNGWVTIKSFSWTGNVLTLQVSDYSPGTIEGIDDLGETYTISVRTSSTISSSDDFRVSIDTGSVTFYEGLATQLPAVMKSATSATLIADAVAPAVVNSTVTLNNSPDLVAGGDTVYMYNVITSATAVLADALSGLSLPGCALRLDSDVLSPAQTGAVYHDGVSRLTWLSNPTMAVKALAVAAVEVTLTTAVQDASTLIVTDSAGRDVTARLGMSATNGSKKITFNSLAAADAGNYTFLYDPQALAATGGLFYVQVSTMDAAGNVGMETYPFMFKSGDVVAPTILSVSPDTGEIVGSLAQVRVLVYDAMAGIDFSRSYAILSTFPGNVVVATTKNFTLTPEAVMAVINTALAADGTADGVYQAGAVIYDKAGNVTSDSRYFTYNSSLPVILTGSENATATKKAGDVITFTLGCAESRTEQNLTVRADSTVIISPPAPQVTTDTSLYTVRSASSTLQNFADAGAWRVDYVAPNFLVYFGATSLARAMKPGDSISISYTSPAIYGAASVDIGVLVQGIALYDDGDSVIDGSGSDGNDQRKNDGIYTGRYTVQPGINTSDAAVNGNFTSQSGKVAGTYQFGAVSIDSLSPVISGVSTSPNPFNPAATGSTSIRFNLNEACAAVTVKIYNSASVLVRTITAGAKNAGANSVAWTGSNDLGVAQPAGLYTITLTATDVVGNSSEVNSSVAITNLSLSIQNITLSTDPLLLPADDGVGDQTTITFEVWLTNATAENLSSVGISYVDDALGTIFGPDIDDEPFAFTTLSIYNNVGAAVSTFDHDGNSGTDDDLSLCWEMIAMDPVTRLPDDNKTNDYNNMVQMRDDGNGVMGDGIFTGRMSWTFRGALAEGTYQVIAQYELVEKDIALVDSKVDSRTTKYYYHAQPDYGAGLTTDQNNPASASLRVQPLVVPSGDATAPIVTLVTARLAGGGTSNITLTSPTLLEGVTRVSAIMDDGFDGSGVSLTNSTIRVKSPHGALISGSQNNDGTTTIWWNLTNTATAPGLYTVEITPRDVAGNVGAMVSKTFTIGDFTAPTVISWTADEHAVSANGSTSIADNISKVAATLQDQDFGSGLNLTGCTIRLYDELNNLLAGAQSSDSLSTVTWTLTSELTQSLLADQRYRIEVYAVDLGGYNRTDSAWFTIPRLADNSGVTFSANSFGCTSAAISPNGDGRKDNCVITFIATGTDTIMPVLQFCYGATTISTIDTAFSIYGQLVEGATVGGLSRYSLTWSPAAAWFPTKGVYVIDVKLGNRASGSVVLYPSVIGRVIWDTLIDTPLVTAPADSLLVSSNSTPYPLAVTGTYGTNGDSVYLRVRPPSGAASIAAQTVTGGVFTFNIALVYGWTTLEIWAEDTAGNISGTVTRQVRLVNGSSPEDIIITIGTGTTHEPVIHPGEALTIDLPYGTTDGDLTVYSTDGRSVINVRAVDDGRGNLRITWDGTGNNIINGVYVFKMQFTLNGQVYIETFPLAIVP